MRSPSTLLGRLALITLLATLCIPLATADTGHSSMHAVEGFSGAVIIQENETVSSIDAMAATIVVQGTVNGNISGMAGSIKIGETGTVTGGINAMAGTITIDGTVGRSSRVAGGTVELNDDGLINGSLDVGGGYVSINGRVTGDVRSGADTLVLGSAADIDGDIRYNANTFTRERGAVVGGNVTNDPELDMSFGQQFSAPSLPGGSGALYGLAVNLILGAMLLLVFPGFSGRVKDRVQERLGLTALLGLVALIVAPVLAVLLALTVIGIPFSLLVLGGGMVAAWTGLVYGQYAIGDWMLQQVDRSSPYVSLVIGLLAFTVLGMLPVIGWVFLLFSLAAGLGGLLLAVHHGYQAHVQE